MNDITLVNCVLPSEVKVPPQGLLYLTSALEAAGYCVDLRDYQLCEAPDPWEPETLVQFVDSRSPIVGFSCMSYALPLVIRGARLIKEQSRDKLVVLGGIGPSGAGAPLLEYCDALDVIVVGEGERTIVDLVAAAKSGRSFEGVAGLIFRDGSRVVTTSPRPRIPSMTELDPPAYSRIDVSSYRIVDSQFSRGCPFSCTFCDIAPYWGRLNTHRPIAHYVDELEELVTKHGARDVFIVDDTFVLSRKTVMRFCDEIIRRRIGFEWGCYARVDLMDEPLMQRMADAGCRKVFYGVESGSNRVLEQIVKETDVDTISAVVKASMRHFESVTTSFVWGFPCESLDDLQETAFFLLYLTSLGASPQLNLALPYSYSPLYGEYRDRILFDPEHSSQLEFYGRSRDRVAAMVRERSDLFSAFYRYPTPSFGEKWDFLEDAGLSPLELQYVYDHPIGRDNRDGRRVGSATP